MKIGIDIDDTMADTFDYLMPYIAEFFNVDIKYLKDNNISYSNLPKEMKERELQFAKKYYDKVIPSTPFKPKVAEYIDKIKALGHEIIVITARDKTLYTDENKTTIEELKNNNIHYDKLICDFDKAKVCKIEKIDLFIDDSIANCRKVNELGIETILFSSKGNINDATNLCRVDNWKDIYEKVKERDHMSKKKSIMIDMDEVIVVGNFSNYLIEFLGEVDFEKLHSQYRQDLIKGREEEFRKIYKYKNLYKSNNGDYINPLPNCVKIIKELNEKYDVYIVTAYIWKEDVIDAATNLKNKFEYLHYWFPFIDTNNFIFMTNKTKIKYDIGIDDRVSYLENCDKKLLFTEFRNKKITDEELENKGIIRVNNWLDIKKELL